MLQKLTRRMTKSGYFSLHTITNPAAKLKGMILSHLHSDDIQTLVKPEVSPHLAVSLLHGSFGIDRLT